MCFKKNKTNYDINLKKVVLMRDKVKHYLKALTNFGIQSTKA
jgi:hypothetical protein